MDDFAKTRVGVGRQVAVGATETIPVLRTISAVSFSLVISFGTIAPSYAATGVSSSIAAPALTSGGAPSPAAETSGEGAAELATPAARAEGQGSMLMSLTGTGDGTTAKFVQPDTPYNGAFTRSFPIEVPPFFEITPKLSVDYNSGDLRPRAKDGFSPLGVGWSLSGGSAINRVSKFGGTPKFDATDVFELDDNALIPCLTAGSTPSCDAGGTHAARFETFERITQVTGNNTWTVTSREGVVSTYKPLAFWNPGSNQDARLKNDYRWLLAEVRDTDGNSITYSYDCAALPTCYVSSLSFGTSSVAFYWETRPDTFTYATGISLSPNVDKRLRTIAVSNSSALVRAYKLSYTVSSKTKASLLTAIQQYGSNATLASGAITGGTSLPADSFTYWDMSSRRMGTMISDLVTANANPETTPSTTATELQSKLVTNGPPDDSYTPKNPNNVFGDFNGDNKTDLIVVKQGTGSCQARFYASGQWSGTSNSPSNGPLITDPGALAPIGFCTEAINWHVGDFNGDGTDDLATTATLGALTVAASAAWTGQGYGVNDAAIAVILLSGGEVTGAIVQPVGAPASGPDVGLRAAMQPSKLAVGDFNGDGIDDLFRGSVFLSNGTSLDPQSWANADWGRVGEFNGDGLADLFVLDGTNGASSRLLLSNGSGFDVSPLGFSTTTRNNLNWPEFEDSLRDPLTGYYYNASTYRNRSGEMCGAGYRWDGATISNSPVDGWYYRTGPKMGEVVSDGHTCILQAVYRERAATRHSEPEKLGVWDSGDLNGDGLTDYIQILESGTSTTPTRALYAYVSNGSTLVKTTLMADIVDHTPGEEGPIGNDLAFSLRDLTGEGKPELIRPIFIRITTSAPEDLSNYRVYHYDGSTYPSLFFINSVPSLFGFEGDYNGDGKIDLMQPFSSAYSDSVIPDLLKRHTLSSGGTVDVEYLPSTYWINGYLPMVLHAVSKVTTADGRGNSSSVKYAYEGGAYDPFEKKFLGFAKVTAELPCETGEPSCPWVIAEYRQEAVAAGALKKLEVYDGSASLMRRIENGYVVNQTMPPFTAHKTSEQVTDYLVGGNVTTRKEWTYDGYANLLEEKDLGLVGSSVDDRITTTSYQLNLTDYLVSYPRQVTVEDAASTVLRDTVFHYDGASAPDIAPVEGHATTTRRWLDPGSRWVDTVATFDSFGQQTAEVDPLGNRTERDYDTASHQYVIEERNPLFFDGDLRQKTTTAWNTVCSAPSSSVDLNGLTTSYQYDQLCRLTRTDFPSTDYETIAYLNIGTPTTQYVEKARKPADGTNAIWSRQYLDGLGR